MPENRKVRLVYQDFRPLRKGETGYSKTRRNLVSPSTGEIISRRQFTKLASRVETPRKSTAKPSTIAKVKKPRKVRSDKGMTRKDYELVKEHLDYQKKPQSYIREEITNYPTKDASISDNRKDYFTEVYKDVVYKRSSISLTNNQVWNAPDFQHMMRGISSGNRKAHGPMAQALEDLDLREPDADYDVGDTP